MQATKHRVISHTICATIRKHQEHKAREACKLVMLWGRRSSKTTSTSNLSHAVFPRWHNAPGHAPSPRWKAHGRHMLAPPTYTCSTTGSDKPRTQHSPPCSPQGPASHRQQARSRQQTQGHCIYIDGCILYSAQHSGSVPSSPSLQPYCWDLCLWLGNPLACFCNCCWQGPTPGMRAGAGRRALSSTPWCTQ